MLYSHYESLLSLQIAEFVNKTLFAFLFHQKKTGGLLWQIYSFPLEIYSKFLSFSILCLNNRFCIIVNISEWEDVSFSSNSTLMNMCRLAGNWTFLWKLTCSHLHLYLAVKDYLPILNVYGFTLLPQYVSPSCGHDLKLNCNNMF